MKHKYVNNTSMLDIILTIAMVFIILFYLSVIQMNQEETKNNVKVNVEFMLTVQWDKQNTDDVDTYFEDPLGNIVHYRGKTAGLMHLDRDDLGQGGDYVDTPYGRFEYNENKEVVSIRGIIPGEYTLNLHMYNKRLGDNKPTVVNVTIEKMNPYGLVLTKQITLTKNGEEVTVCRFTLDKDGNVTDVNYLEKPLAYTRNE